MKQAGVSVVRKTVQIWRERERLIPGVLFPRRKAATCYGFSIAVAVSWYDIHLCRGWGKNKSIIKGGQNDAY